MAGHDTNIPQYVIDRIMAKRGKLHVFDALEPRTTALVVIDMQNFFVAEVETAKSIVPNINRLAAALRDAGGTIIWVLLTVAESMDGPSLWPLYHDYFFTDAKRKAHKDGLTEGSEGHKLYPDLDRRAEDVVVRKTRFSAMLPQPSQLERALEARGVQNLVICGTATNFCCETTARDAMMLGYKVVMVSDGNAARYDEDHLAGLTSIFQSFGDVYTTDETLAVLGLDGRAAAAE